MANIVKHTKKYRVKKAVSYPDPILGIFVLESGDVLEQCIDQPQYFSNGLALVTEANILHRVPEFFELIEPKVHQAIVIGLVDEPQPVKKLSLKEKVKRKLKPITISIKSK